jgi:hypothetical protein
VRTHTIVDGMSLLLPYYNNPDGFHASAEHDALHMAPTDKPLTPDDLSKMVALGWFQERVEYEGDFAPEHYQADESWTAYV